MRYAFGFLSLRRAQASRGWPNPSRPSPSLRGNVGEKGFYNNVQSCSASGERLEPPFCATTDFATSHELSAAAAVLRDIWCASDIMTPLNDTDLYRGKLFFAIITICGIFQFMTLSHYLTRTVVWKQSKFQFSHVFVKPLCQILSSPFPIQKVACSGDRKKSDNASGEKIADNVLLVVVRPAKRRIARN